MKDETRDEAILRANKAEALLKIREKDLNEYVRTEQVMKAAGLLDDDQLQQAHDIVRSFSK